MADPELRRPDVPPRAGPGRQHVQPARGERPSAGEPDGRLGVDEPAALQQRPVAGGAAALQPLQLQQL